MPAHPKTRSTSSSTDGEAAPLAQRSYPLSRPYDARSVRQGQLHVPTERSRGGSGILPKPPSINRRSLFVPVHNRSRKGDFRSASDMGGILVVPGEENTVPDRSWPSPSHLRLFDRPRPLRAGTERMTVRLAGRRRSLAHPAWPGNLGTGAGDLSTCAIRQTSGSSRCEISIVMRISIRRSGIRAWLSECHTTRFGLLPSTTHGVPVRPGMGGSRSRSRRSRVRPLGRL